MNLNRPPQRLESTSKPGTAVEAVRLEQQKELAKGRLDRAYQLKVDGNDEAARLALAEAVRTDSALITNPSAVTLAQALTGQPRDKAIIALLNHSQTAAVLSRKPAFALTADSYGFALELALLPIVCIVFLAAVMPAYALLAAGQGGFGSTSVRPPATDIWPYVAPVIGLAAWFVVDVSGAFILGTLIGGSGALSRFTRRILRAVTVWLVLITIAATIGLIGLTTGGQTTVSATGELHISILVTVCAWVVEAAVMIGPLVFGAIGGRAHEMGWLKGILAILISSGALGLVTLFLLGIAHF